MSVCRKTRMFHRKINRLEKRLEVKKMKLPIKIIIFCIIYTILHFLYKLFPYDLVAVISCNTESVLNHLKLASYSYFLTGVVDYFYRIKIKGWYNDKFFWSWYSRVLFSILIGWVYLILWYTPFVFIGMITTVWLKVVYSFKMLIISFIFTDRFDTHFEYASTGVGRISGKIKIYIIILTIVTIYIYTSFTFVQPYIDLFEIP